MKYCELGEHEVQNLFWSRTKTKKSACMQCAKQFMKPLSYNPKIKEMNSNDNKAPNRSIKRNNTNIKPISDKQAKRLKEYRIVRDEYLNEHPSCERCGNPNNLTIHHMKGKIGDLLCDKRYFKTLCMKCHNFIEIHVEIAKETGFSLNRLDK